MSAYYSKFGLNSYEWTPYFRAFVPTGYPTGLVLQKARAFRRLPSGLRVLAENAKKWAVSNGFDTTSIDEWYDDAGNELDPDTGAVLTDAQTDALWQDDPALSAMLIKDVPVPAGGFPDPSIWAAPKPIAGVTPDVPDPADILAAVASRGLSATERAYGITLGSPNQNKTGLDWGEARRDFAARTSKVLASHYFDARPAELSALKTALKSADVTDDLWGPAEVTFARVEEYERAKRALHIH